MVSIIKNQLLKHLSRFTKNLSADKINLSTFKGEGELSNLELDENVLTELLELPTWLRLTKAWCNRVTFGIPWTKLKSVPICLNLDDIHITLETCEELRTSRAPTGASYTPGKYSFIQKVIDGITVCVNNVYVVFNSPAFVATIQITRIRVESKSPKFTKSDLRMTRLKNQEKGQVLIFKELEWQTVRIEAKSTKDENLTPLRLLTNQARCRIVIKKRLSDCFILGSRLAIILDDLLWVLTDSQLRAVVHFLDSLSDLVEKATRLTRQVKAARKLEELPEYRAQMAQEIHETSEKSKLFNAYDVVETSYHFLSNQIVLHLCDDPGSGRSSHPPLKDGGALQICLKKFQIDYYPYHLAKGNRKHWPKYNVSSVPHSMWQDQALASFRAKLMELLDYNRIQHTPLSRADKRPQNVPKSPEVDPRRNSQKEYETGLKIQLSKLMTTCIILRIEDFTVYRVATSNNKGGLKEFVFGDRSSMSLPRDSNIVHAEFIYYYYPADCAFPLPPPKFYVQVNPITVLVDFDSCLWLNSFILNLFQSLENSKNDVQVSNYSYVDVKIEAILPKINFESAVDQPTQKDRPKWLSFQVTRATVTNTRSLEQSSRADLAKCVDSFHMGSLFFGSGFPSEPDDFYLLTQKFFDHISTEDNIRTTPPTIDASFMENTSPKFSREMLWLEAKDVWCISLDPVWADFGGASAIGVNKSVAFLDAVPVTVWLHTNMDPNSTLKPPDAQAGSAPNADIHAIVHVSNLVSVQMNHYQYLFLMRLADNVAMMTTYLSLDAERILKVESNSSMVMGVFLPQLEVTFVMPSHCPGKESSGGDGESFLPDSSSIAGDAVVGSTQSMWHNSNLSISQLETSRKAMVNGSPNRLDGTCYPEEYDQIPEVYHVEEFPSIQQQQQQIVNLPANLNVGLTSMKRGLTSLMSSIDSALKPSADDLSDTVSIRSDASSDSEQFVHINLEVDVPGMDLMFVVQDFYFDHDRVEEAAEVVEEKSPVTSASDHSVSSASGRRKDLVSVSTFKLKTLEFLYQSVGYSSSLKIQIGDLACDDCSSIPWDEFQSKFNTRSRVWNSNPPSVTATSKVKLRLDHSLAVPTSRHILELDLTDRRQLAKAFKDLLTLKVNELSLNLNMSTVTNLTDLIEDEFLPIFFPIKVELKNVKVHLNEDRPPANITSPGPVPMDLNIPHMNISRDENGVAHILPDIIESSSHNIDGASQVHSISHAQLLQENEELKKRLPAFERISEENHSLRKSKEESDVLRLCLQKSQDEIILLLNEKEKLINEIRQLQYQVYGEGKGGSKR